MSEALDPLGLLLGDPILGRALLLQDQVVAMGGDAVKPGKRAARASRDQPADNDVLLQAFERI